MFGTNKNEQAPPGMCNNNNSMENNTMEAEQWLCAHLDYTAVGTALLKGTWNRDSALLVQALRQQLTKASSSSAGAANLNKMISNDIFMLRNRKQSVLSLFLCPVQQLPSNVSSVDCPPKLHYSISSTSLINSSTSISSAAAVVGLPSSVPTFGDLFKDELSRLLNVVTSFRHGRDYLLSVANGRQCLYEIALALRNKRVRGATVDNLLAALQKMSIRQSVRKELILNGMMEWLCRCLSQVRQSLSALEFGTALLHNLCLCPISHQTILRHKEDLLATVLLLIGQAAKSTQLFHCTCATLFALLSLPRVRAHARERGDTERVLNECVRRSSNAGTAASNKSNGSTMQLTEQQRQQLAALLHIVRTAGVEQEISAGNRKRTQMTENIYEQAEEQEQFPDYLEAEIDSTDPLVPSLNELFGHELLFRRFLLPDSVDSAPLLLSLLMPSVVMPSQTPPPFGYIEDDRDSIPGVVPVQRTHPRSVVVGADHATLHQRLTVNAQTRQKNLRTTTTHDTLATARKLSSMKKASMLLDKETTECHSPLAHFSIYSSERSNSMSSHATFIVHNNARRPLLAASGFASLVATMKNVGGGRWQRTQWQPDQNRIPMKMVDAEEQQHFDNLEIDAASAEEVANHGKKREDAKNMTKPTATQSAEKLEQKQQKNKDILTKKTKIFNTKMDNNNKKAEISRKWPKWQKQNSGEQQQQKRIIEPKKGERQNVKTEDSSREKLEEEEEDNSGNCDEYLNVFAARPKVCRTPPAKLN